MKVEGEVVFAVLAFEGVPVILNRETWQAEAGDGETGSPPEVGAYSEDVKAAIGFPVWGRRNHHGASTLCLSIHGCSQTMTISL